MYRSGPLAGALQSLLILAVAIAWQLPYFDRWISLMDEGHILAYADLLAGGGELYRDATLLPLPGAFYLLEIAFRVFGPSMIVARWILVIEFAVLCVIAFHLLRRMASLRVAWAGVGALLVYRIWAFPHWHMYSYSTTSLLLLAAALLALVRWFEAKRLGWVVTAGLLTGLGVFCKQDYGAAAMLAMNLALAIAVSTEPEAKRAVRARVLMAFNVPAVAVGASVAVHFLRQGLFEEMFKQTVLNHLFGIATFEYTGLPPLLPLLSQSTEIRSAASFTIYVPSILATVDWPRVLSSAFYRETILFDLLVRIFFYGPYVVVAVGIVRCWRRRALLRDPTSRPAALVELALTLQAAGLVAVLSRPVDWIHVLVLYWPLVCLVVFYSSTLLPARPIPRRIVQGVWAVAACVVVGYTAFLGWQLRVQHTAPMASPRAAGIWVRPEEAAAIDEAVEYATAHSARDEPFAVLPYAPLVSFLADRPAPHRSAYILWPVEYYESRQPELIRALESGGGHLLYNVYQLMQFPRMAEFAPTLFDYLVEHYEIERAIGPSEGGFLFAGVVRREPRRGGRALFDAAGPTPRLRVEASDGSVRDVPREAWPRFLVLEQWPFRPVMALRPLAQGRRTVLSVPLEVSLGTTLETAVGVHPMRWFMHPPSWVRFAIDVVTDDGRTALFRRTLDPHRDRDQRGWFEVELSLDAFAGRRVELEFSTTCERRECEILEMGGWEPPRIRGEAAS